jgi:hypothetical protein
MKTSYNRALDTRGIVKQMAVRLFGIASPKLPADWRPSEDPAQPPMSPTPPPQSAPFPHEGGPDLQPRSAPVLATENYDWEEDEGSAETLSGASSAYGPSRNPKESRRFNPVEARSMQGAVAKICNICRSTESGRQWYRDASNAAKHRCQRCYRAARKGIQAAKADKTCANCQTTSSKKWLRNPTNQEQIFCRRCYQAVYRMLQAAKTDKTCIYCLRKSSRHWYTSLTNKKQYRCHSCYIAEARAAISN